jgi:hypothetical protein
MVQMNGSIIGFGRGIDAQHLIRSNQPSYHDLFIDVCTQDTVFGITEHFFVGDMLTQQPPISLLR